MEQGRLMITDFTLLDVATVTADLTIESIGKHRAYTVKQRVLANEPLVVMGMESETDMTEFYDYIERTS